MSSERYNARGVSPDKKEVHAVVDSMDQGLFPGAFCKVTEDYLTGDPTKCNLIHADGSGTKSILAYLHYRETGDASVFRGIAQDSIVMNVDDLLCAGVTGRILISSTVNRNARNFPGEALAELIRGTEEFLHTLRDYGVDIVSGGGETADVGDLTGTVTVDSCAVAVMNRIQVVDNSRICPGLAIIGIASYGKAVYENFENSGIASNGLTSARHDLLSPHYREKYLETYDSKTDPSYLYCGPYRMQDALPNSDMTVGEALLSPTRTYAPVMHRLLTSHREEILGLVHCSGGGQTKCIRFGEGVHFIKDNFLPVPPIFREIQKVSGTSTKEMHQVFNMGHRMEVYCHPKDVALLLDTIEPFGIATQVIGRTESSNASENQNHITLENLDETINYSPES
jgi:phosphoribosylformylglycinamidine cyclo-ligase